MGCKNCEQVMSDDSMFEGKISPFPLCLHKNQLVNVKSATVEQKVGLTYTRAHTCSIVCHKA